jgi:TetR/AcrR family transcriptional regulator, transcriptional repressor for nem operon
VPPPDALTSRRELARALTDRDLSDQVLARGVETALKLLDDRA